MYAYVSEKERAWARLSRYVSKFVKRLRKIRELKGMNEIATLVYSYLLLLYPCLSLFTLTYAYIPLFILSFAYPLKYINKHWHVLMLSDSDEYECEKNGAKRTEWKLRGEIE